MLFLDPFEQWNRIHSLSDSDRSYLRDQLAQLKACRGTKQCTVGSSASSTSQSESSGVPSYATGNIASAPNLGIRYKKRKYPPMSKLKI